MITSVATETTAFFKWVRNILNNLLNQESKLFKWPKYLL